MPQAKFCTLLRDQFSSNDRVRGESYFKSGRVGIHNVSGDIITASVEGSEQMPYTVEIERDPKNHNICEVDCDCPRFDDTGSCKHVWAVLRTLDELFQKNSTDAERTDAGEDDDDDRELESLLNMANRGSAAGKKSAAQTKSPLATTGGQKKPVTAPTFAPPNPWQSMLASIKRSVSEVTEYDDDDFGESQSSYLPMYLIDLSEQLDTWPKIRVILKDVEDGSAEKQEMLSATRDDIDQCDPSEFLPSDQRIIRSLMAANPDPREIFGHYGNYLYSSGRRSNRYYEPDSIAVFEVNDKCSDFLIREMIETGRLLWQTDLMAQPVAQKIEKWIPGQLHPTIVLTDAGSDQIEMSLEIQAGELRIDASAIAWVWDSGLVLMTDCLGETSESLVPWVMHFIQHGSQQIPADQRDGLIMSLLEIPNAPKFEWPQSWNLRDEIGTPQPVLKIRWPEVLPRNIQQIQLPVEPVARYGEHDFPMGLNESGRVFDAASSRILSRNPEQEFEKLEELNRSTEFDMFRGDLSVLHTAVPALNERLSALGWIVEVQGRPLVAPGQFSFEVASGLDWFDLSGGAAYAAQIVPLPVLLQAVRRKENFVRLDDGSHGLLPTEWIDRFGKFLELAETEGESLRFGKSQALLLDSLLAEQDNVRIDAGFRSFRKKLAAFDGIKPGKEPKNFDGELREYQRDGLGWFGFLQEFGFGGCLADDMGLGKTIQVLALLEHRRARRLKKDETRKPTLVVVPKSLIFNWIEEAARFTPKLNVCNYTGIERKDRADQMNTCDIVLTTYGTLRNDIVELAAIEFDYAILDEAQAIKNPKTGAAKSSFAIRADHRLTMTGTPIENHLGDLWSQFRFLNPQLLGHSQAFAAFTRNDCDPESLQQLSRAIRPFVLRRTKQEVLKELPEKTEQTLYCEMSPNQTRQYNELRDHYRIKLGDTVRELGLNRSKIHVLEALLRLRQAACDGRLVNPKKGAPGAKLELLLEQIEEVIGEGHKVLVFSQFTSLLALLQKDLKKKKVPYEYLDGKTNDRKSCVHRFQNDENCRLFLISLKAGGQGLNLTAADYVYILDPWWNPAVEAQAIDRAHRIGQQKNVFAYRMIAKGTVEEKIVELQKTKRALADSIISGNNSLIRSLTAEDLQMLLA